MNYPSVDEYQDIIQDLRTLFVDTDLQERKVVTDRMGLPRGLSGGFAITYALVSDENKKAIRCFKYEVASREFAYTLISKTLKRVNNPYFVDFDFQPKGLKYKGALLPCLKMEWVEGETLSAYIRRKCNDPSTFTTLRAQFEALQARLESDGIAHGDIQADNIIVCPDGSLKLIDYDGLYVEGLTVSDASEVGLPNYQHPERSLVHFGPEIDRFSFAMLDLTFAALSIDPSLLQRFPAGDQAILFDSQDFLNPFVSKRFAALEDLGVSLLAKNFINICLAPITKVPNLSEFRAGRNIPTAHRRARTSVSNNFNSEALDIAKQTARFATDTRRIPTSAGGTTNKVVNYPSLGIARFIGVAAIIGLIGIGAIIVNDRLSESWLDDELVCRNTLNLELTDWDLNSQYINVARQRGKSVEDCQNILRTKNGFADTAKDELGLDNELVCRNTLNLALTDWDLNSQYIDVARRRGLTLSDCQQVLGFDEVKKENAVWDHNGSTMKLIADGPSRQFVYHVPRPGLREVGIQSGTLLFDGRRDGNYYSGTAYTFSSRCGMRGFQVSGNVAPDQRSVTMYGKAPLVGSNCQISSYRAETLAFTFLGQ